jgi:hypothetical protein
MKLFLSISLACICLCSHYKAWSQKGMTNVGIQVKPILPVAFLGMGTLTNDTAGVHFENGLSSGYNFGIIIRHNFTSLLGFETGINYVRRKYSLKISESGFDDNSVYRIISYEIPFVIMVYSRIGDKLYVNGSLGPTLDMFASHVETFDRNFNHVAFRNHIFQPAISANLGFEYRTEKSGFIYIGGSFQRPFQYIYLSKVGYYRDNRNIVVSNELSGSYFTIDLRYFFPENKRRALPED